MPRPNAALDTYAPAFFGLNCDRLVDRIVAEGAAYADGAGVKTPIRSMSSLILLDDYPLTVTELASSLGMTHAGAIKAANALIKAGLVQRSQDPDDGRRKPLMLTQAGRSAAQETRAFLQLAQSVYRQIFNEIGIDTFQAIRDMGQALDRCSFAQRLADVAQNQSSPPLKGERTGGV